MKNRTLLQTIAITVFILLSSSLLLYYFYNNSVKTYCKKPIYSIHKESFELILNSETSSFDFDKNSFERYFLEDTIKIEQVLNKEELNEIEELIYKSSVFNFDSIYVTSKTISISLPDLKTRLFVKDRNKSRQFVMSSHFSDNELSSKKDYNHLEELISDLNNILDRNIKIKKVPESDLVFY
jgi:hypothetical protein